MDNNNEALLQQQEQERQAYLREELARGVAFEEIINSKGFAYLKAFYENSIRLFANKAVKEGFKDMEEYQLERGMVMGMGKLFDGVNSSIATLEGERKKQPQEEQNATT